ncbi:hypothetical protein [Halalkalibacter wakoensis]|uniref:hypothetical protein n=1 Tax=Halalkalibacter wakoensis TaxID=127891 RepID=UPI000B154133|nr:hypothetical protein [Halalkalibacter wakoensis]
MDNNQEKNKQLNSDPSAKVGMNLPQPFSILSAKCGFPFGKETRQDLCFYYLV